MVNRQPGAPARKVRKAIEEHRRAAYREVILQAATTVFGRLGFNDARMSEVAAEAGVSVGTLYNYFENKDELISALIEIHHGEYLKCIAPIEDVQDPVERIRQLIHVSYRFFDERAEIVEMAVRAGVLQAHIAAELTGDADMTAHDRVLAVYELALSQAAHAGRIRTDVSPAQLAVVLDGITSTLIHAWIRAGRDRPLAPQTDFVIKVFLEGAQPR